jgi:uncharacterized damage-inducible protein DinB
MSALANVVAEMRAQRDQLYKALAQAPTEQMGALGLWGQREMPIRSMLYMLVNHIAEHTVQVIKTRQLLGLDQSEAQLILGQLAQLHGTLEGLLVGLTDEELAQAPAGEWSIRETLEHITSTEKGYGKRLEQALVATKPAR